MLKIYNNSEVYTLSNYSDRSLKKQDCGFKTLCFKVSPKESVYKYIAEEVVIEFDNTFFVVKKISEYRNESTIECDLCVDDFLKNAYFSYEQVEKTLTEHFSLALAGLGWTTLNAEMVTTRQTVRLVECNTLDILNDLQKQFDIKFSYDNKNKVITVIKYKEIQPKGVYFTDELNLKEISFKGDSCEFATKLICRGKQNDDGTYVTFASINGGLDYIANNTYSNKVITRLMSDDRFTTAQGLKDEAIERLKILAIPNRSYECSVIDLANIKPEYKLLSYDLYDIVILIDRNRNTRLEHRIVEITEYPQKKHENTAILSTVKGKIETTIKKVDTIINSTGKLEINGTSLNEIKRDGTTNSMLIKNTYTKGETNHEISTAVTQSATEIRTDVTNQISAINVGGSNYCNKTNQGILNWFWSMQTGGVTYSEVIENGIKTCLMTRDNVAQTGWSVIGYNDIGRNLYEPETEYTVSFDVKASSTTDFNLQLLEANGDNLLAGVYKKVNSIAEPNQWTKIVVILKTVSPLPSSVTQVLYINGLRSEPQTTYQFKNLKIEKGNVPTSWTPSTIDTDTKIASSIQQTEDAINMEFINGKISGSTEFTANGMDIYNGAIAIYDKPKDQNPNKTLFADPNGNLYVQRLGKEDFYFTSGSVNNGQNPGASFWQNGTEFLQIWKSTEGNAMMSSKNPISLLHYSADGSEKAVSLNDDGFYVNNSLWIERATTSFGNYIKFADGTMIITQNWVVMEVAVDVPDGAIYRGNIGTAPNFPVEFYSAPDVTVSLGGAFKLILSAQEGKPNTMNAFTNEYGNNTLIGVHSATRIPIGGLYVAVYVHAIGRWKA